ncbi:MAG: hypothetical protein GYA34_16025 [Chloroflexi bacterium]|nr:hypothetical protein [Chloroflexota bacterium]
MARKNNSLWVILTTVSILFSGCQSKPAEPTATSVDPAAIFTAAAETAVFLQTQSAALTPSATPTYTSTPVTPTVTPTNTLTPTVASSVAVAGVSPDKAEFVSDVTVPDETQFAPAQTFRKTWRIKNIGTTTWTTSYSLVYATGNQMNGAASVSFPNDVAPGSTIDLSVDFTAPMQQGRYVSYWMLRNSSGKNFGVGPNADQPIYVVINVVGNATVTPTSGTVTPATATVTTAANATSAPTATATIAVAAPTATTASSAKVGNLGISVNTTNYTGPCKPYQLTVPVSFSVYETTTVSFELIAGSDTGGMNRVIMPSPKTVENMAPGTYPGQYTVNVLDSASGWLQFHIISPDDLYSSKVNILIICQ